MKRGLIIGGFTFVFVLISFAFVSAISTDIKDAYFPKETIISEIKGNILDNILPENVELKRGFVKVPWEYDVKKLGDKYFIWGIVPENPNNYTLIIKNVSTTVNGQNQQIDYMENFTVFGALVDYYVKPGFISTTEDFEIFVVLNEDDEKTIEVDFPFKREITLKPGENKIEFSVKNYKGGNFVIINVGKYKVPVNLIGFEEKNETPGDIDDPDVVYIIKFIPKEIRVIILANSQEVFPFAIVNTGNEEVRSFYLEYNRNVLEVVPRAENIRIRPQEIIYFNATIRKGLNVSYVQEEIRGRYGNNLVVFPVIINMTIGNVTRLNNTTGGSTLYYCAELGGDVCTANQVCNGTSVNSFDGGCCLGICKKGKASTKGWIGFLIAAIVLILLLLVWAKYKKAKPTNVLQKRIEESKGK